MTNEVESSVVEEATSTDDRPYEERQDWAMCDGATAYQLISRYADNWSDIGGMMDAWRALRADHLRSRDPAAIAEDARLAAAIADAERLRWLRAKNGGDNGVYGAAAIDRGMAIEHLVDEAPDGDPLDYSER